MMMHKNGRQCGERAFVFVILCVTLSSIGKTWGRRLTLTDMSTFRPPGKSFADLNTYNTEGSAHSQNRRLHSQMGPNYFKNPRYHGTSHSPSKYNKNSHEDQYGQPYGYDDVERYRMDNTDSNSRLKRDSRGARIRPAASKQNEYPDYFERPRWIYPEMSYGNNWPNFRPYGANYDYSTDSFDDWEDKDREASYGSSKERVQKKNEFDGNYYDDYDGDSYYNNAHNPSPSYNRESSRGFAGTGRHARPNHTPAQSRQKSLKPQKKKGNPSLISYGPYSYSDADFDESLLAEELELLDKEQSSKNKDETNTDDRNSKADSRNRNVELVHPVLHGNEEIRRPTHRDRNRQNGRPKSNFETAAALEEEIVLGDMRKRLNHGSTESLSEESSNRKTYSDYDRNRNGDVEEPSYKRRNFEPFVKNTEDRGDNRRVSQYSPSFSRGENHREQERPNREEMEKEREQGRSPNKRTHYSDEDNAEKGSEADKTEFGLNEAPRRRRSALADDYYSETLRPVRQPATAAPSRYYINQNPPLYRYDDYPAFAYNPVRFFDYGRRILPRRYVRRVIKRFPHPQQEKRLRQMRQSRYSTTTTTIGTPTEEEYTEEENDSKENTEEEELTTSATKSTETTTVSTNNAVVLKTISVDANEANISIDALPITISTDDVSSTTSLPSVTETLMSEIKKDAST